MILVSYFEEERMVMGDDTLELDNGKTKEFCTCYKQDAYAFGYGNHVAKCGLHRHKQPNKSKGCDHIDRALESLEHRMALYALWIYCFGLSTIGSLPTSQNK